MALDGAEFGMVDDPSIALDALHMQHPPLGTPHIGCDLLEPLPPLTVNFLDIRTTTVIQLGRKDALALLLKRSTYFRGNEFAKM
jgi:hypothetical protein